MPRPWARERDDAPDRGGPDERADGSDPPSAEVERGAGAAAAPVDAPGGGSRGGPAGGLADDLDDDLDDPSSFPTLDPPWPDGDLPGSRWPDAGDASHAPPSGSRSGSLAEPPSDGIHIVWPDEDGEWAGADPPDPPDGAGPVVDGRPPADPHALDEAFDDEAFDQTFLRLGPSWSEPAPCRVPRRQVRPVHRRRSRHSFEPADLSDDELDRLLRGPSAGRGPGPDTGPVARPWPVWVKVVLAATAVLAVSGVVGALNAAAGDTETITTRGEGRRPSRTGDAATPPPGSPMSSVPAAGASPVPEGGRGPVQPPTPGPGREVLPDRPAAGDAAPAGSVEPAAGMAADPAVPAPSTAAPTAVAPAATAATATAPACHPSYDPCVPVVDDVDCAGGRGDGPAYVDGPVDVIGPDAYGLDGDADGQGCE
jgi:hypothetical protein